ncbi:hypothetical protein PIB30_102641, partial [Stylosanthes scabra]|nr:hypothetical protein [Stylosanthes scabra]
TSRALIDMESGEFMLRIHDECLVLQVYQGIHPIRDSKTCIKMEEVDPASTKPPDKPTNKNKAHKKKDKEQKSKPEYSNKLPRNYQTSKAQNSFLTWVTMKQGHDTEDISSRFFDSP